MPDTQKQVLLDFDPATGIATITFNRPDVFNALDVTTAAAFEQAVAGLRKLDGLRCVCITGAGKAFMAGGDVGAFAADLEAADRTLAVILNHMHPAILALRGLDAPIVAGVNGVAAGAGLSLVLAADYVVAAADSKFVLAYDKLGVAPDCGGSWFLPHKVGRGMAFELMLTGPMLLAQEALRIGIVNRISPESGFTDDLGAVLSKIANGPTRAFGMFKALMDADLPLAAHMEMEREHFMAATQSTDFKAAARAFVEKERVVFLGR